MVGQILSHYKIIEKLGEGGMGVLYRALDTHLDRTVAIKVLRPETIGDPERKRRFILEAKAASALNHPNIITIYDIDQANGVDFIAMEFVDGQALDHLIADHGLALADVLSHAVQIAWALAAAHGAGIVHRDIKPANIMVTGAGHIKVLDFGLAKLTERLVLDEGAPTVTVGRHTEQGVVLGTVAYMSPEQAEGKPVDARTDVFSFGAVLYEMLAGRRPFQGDSQLSTLMAVLRDPPPPLKTIRPDAPPELERIILRSLEKNREARYPSAVELSKDLAACQAVLTAPQIGLRALIRRPQFAIPVLVLVLAIVSLATWFGVHSSRVRWARNVALPEISRLLASQRFHDGFRLARQAQRYIPDDPQLRQLWNDLSAAISVRTIPAGADVYYKDYMAFDAGWELLGKSPIENARIPVGFLRWKATKEGFEPAEGVFAVWDTPLQFTLEPHGAARPGMVRVPGGRYQFRTARPVELQDYWLDKYEVSNKQFKEFVDRGGYQKREYWKQPFVKQGSVLSWERAMTEFRDATGRPGPATWELGTYREGKADFPVSGVSWYEAAAYAEFTGKSLPTVYHWYKAAGTNTFSQIYRLSNFGGEGPVRIGDRQGLSPYGTYDMAGNVKEWCWSQAGHDGRRYILGGAWNEPTYMFSDPDAQPPFERAATYGFRCAQYAAPLPEALTAPIETLTRDYSKEKPVSDEVFRFYQSIYSYDRTDLKPHVESVDDSSAYWRKEKVTFDAAYGNERVIAYLFLPKNAAPPYQTVIHFPGAYAVRIRSSENLSLAFVDFVIRSGRAVLYPIYKGTFERGIQAPSGPNVVRDRTIQWSKDLGRSIDYLETRQDIDREKLAYYGLSMGSAYGPILISLEPRLKVTVLLSGGFYFSKPQPEVDPINFTPRVRIPALMLNGRHDFLFALETSQVPMFRLLGAPEKDKRHVVFDAGHVPPKMQDVIKEILDWLDHYLGPVKTIAASAP